MAYGDASVLVRYKDGKPVEIFDDGAIKVSGDIRLINGDIQIGAVEIKNSSSDDRTTVKVLPSGDFGLTVIPGDVNPLHSSQVNATVQFQYNTSGDLIYIDKVIGNTRYRRSTFKSDYTGSQTIDTTKVWTFGSWEIV